jgi:hypothetical protein
MLTRWATFVRDVATGLADERRLDRAADENAELEFRPLGPDEKVAGLPREHDRMVGGVNPLLSQVGGGFAYALPGVPQVL